MDGYDTVHGFLKEEQVWEVQAVVSISSTYRLQKLRDFIFS